MEEKICDKDRRRRTERREEGEETNNEKMRWKKHKYETRERWRMKRRTADGRGGQEEEEVVFISLPWHPRRPYGV